MALASAVCTLQQNVILPHEDTCCAGNATHINREAEGGIARAARNEMANGAEQEVTHVCNTVVVKTLVYASKVDRTHETCVMVPLGRVCVYSLMIPMTSDEPLGQYVPGWTTKVNMLTCQRAWEVRKD
eukprot:4039067-Amphidinium_carterae.1